MCLSEPKQIQKLASITQAPTPCVHHAIFSDSIK